MLPNLALELAERGSLTAERMEVILEVIRPRYRVGVIRSVGSLTTLGLTQPFLKARLGQKLGRVSPARMREVDVKLLRLFGFVRKHR